MCFTKYWLFKHSAFRQQLFINRCTWSIKPEDLMWLLWQLLFHLQVKWAPCCCPAVSMWTWWRWWRNIYTQQKFPSAPSSCWSFSSREGWNQQLKFWDVPVVFRKLTPHTENKKLQMSRLNETLVNQTNSLWIFWVSDGFRPASWGVSACLSPFFLSL